MSSSKLGLSFGSQHLSNQIKQCLKIKRNSNQAQDEQFKKQYATHNLIIILLCLGLLLGVGQTTNINVTSQSNITGQLANYYFTLTNHSNPTQIIIQFSPWSVNDQQPYNSDFQIKQNTTLSILNCSPFSTGTIRCLITNVIFTSSVYPSAINLVMTSIYNPSSTKPYLITFYPKTTTTQTIQAFLTMTTPLSSSFIMLGYNSSIAASTPNASILLQFDNYVDNMTVVNLTYDGSLVNISMSSGSYYNVISNSNGLKQITGWTGVSLGTTIITSIQIANPSFALSYTISGISYFIQNGTTYLIQKYTVTIQLVAISFDSLSSSSLISMGSISNSVIISESCSLAPINGANTSAYIILNYDSSLISFNANSSCSYVSSTQCMISSISTLFTLSQLNSLIPSVNISSATFTITIYSYFAIKNKYYSTCSGSFQISLIQQVFSPTSNLVNCNFEVTGSNNLQVSFTGQSVMSGDILYIGNFLGSLNLSSGINWTYNNSSNFYKTALNSSFLTTSSSLISVNFSLIYLNPTYTSSNSLSLSLYRNQIKYGSGSDSLCAINKPKITSSVCSIYNATTYAKTSLMIQMSLGLNDYKVGDYLVIRFMGSNKYVSGNNSIITKDKQSFSQLYLSLTNNQSLQAKINSIVIPYTLVNSSSIKLIFNSSTVVASISTSSSISFFIRNITNPIAQYYAKSYLITFNSANQMKQSSLTNAVWIAASAISVTSSSIVTLLTQNNITLNASQPYRSLISSDTNILSTTLQIQSPFSCANTNSSLKVDYNWLKSSSSLISTLVNCSLGYFTDMSKTIVIKQYVYYTDTSANITTNYSVLSTSSIYYVSSTCGNNCYLCSVSSPLNCSACFNSTYTPLVYLSSGSCYSSCPIGSYLDNSISSVTCSACHQICDSCSASTYDSCNSCASNFVFNSNGICESICGQNQYFVSLSGSCGQCDGNCKGCIDSSACYLCKDGAVLIGTVCVFASCTKPCKSCMGSLTKCTSCVSSPQKAYYLYQTACYSNCPVQTYQDQSVCIKISTINLYFPCIILGAVLFLVGFGLKCFSPKIKRPQQSKQVAITLNQVRKYKISLLRFMSVALACTELISVFIILAQGSAINPAGVNETIIIGLVIYFVCNIIFGVGYYKIIFRKQKKFTTNLSNNNKMKPGKQQKFKMQHKLQQKQQNKQKTSQNSQSLQQNDQQSQFLKKYDQNYNIRQIFIVVLSCCISFRIYRILQANFFSQQSSLMKNEYKKNTQNLYKNQALFNSETALKQSSRQNIQIQPKVSNNKITNIGKTLPSLIKVEPKGSNKQNKFINNKTLNLEVINQNQQNSQAENRLQNLIEAKQLYRNKFIHPFYSYLYICSLLTSSVLFLIGSILQILYKRYQNMMFWGLDSIIVIIIMYFVSIWDLWKMLNLPLQNQASELSSAQQEINNTMQNIKPRQQQEQQNDFQILKNDFGATTKLSPKKYSPIKNKSSPKALQDNLIRKLSSKKSPIRKQSLETQKNKSPSQRTEKWNKNKGSKKSIDNTSFEDYQDQIPKLKIFDDIQGQKDLQKGQKLKKWNVTMHPKMRSSTHGIGNKQTKNQQLSRTSRNKGWKLQDIYLGFLQMQQNNNQPQIQDSNNENDQIQTVQITNNFLNTNQKKQWNNQIDNEGKQKSCQSLKNNQKIQNQYGRQQGNDQQNQTKKQQIKPKQNQKEQQGQKEQNED